MERLDHIDQLVVETLGSTHGTHQNHQRRGGTLLSGVAKGRVHHILHRQVQVSRRSHDNGVLARSLGQEAQVRTPGAEHLRGFDRTGQDDAFHALVGDELLAQSVILELD